MSQDGQVPGESVISSLEQSTQEAPEVGSLTELHQMGGSRPTCYSISSLV
ncbi:hypothetical protein AVEN_215779-1, partial [Araneus ventricosus]